MKKTKQQLIAYSLACWLTISGLSGFGQHITPLSENTGLQKNGIIQSVGKGEMLYDQTGQPSGQGGIISQFFSDYPLYTCQAADDFEVTGIGSWLVESVYVNGFYSQSPPGGPATKANVFIYSDNNGVPGGAFVSFLQIEITGAPGGQLSATFPQPVELPQGHYWLSFQPVMTYSTAGMWYWAKQAAPTIENEFCWKNPGGGFGLPGTSNWRNGSAIWSNQGFTDWNLAFTIYGTLSEQPPLIASLSTNSPYPGQHVRIYGQNFGDYGGNCTVMVNGISFPGNITYWSENAVFFGFPDLMDPLAQISVQTANGAISNTIDVIRQIPGQCHFITPNENEELSDDLIHISVSAEIMNDLILYTKFFYLPEGTTDWIYLGDDTDGTSKTYGTTVPAGSGDGWALNWDVAGIDFLRLTLKAEMTDIFGHVLTGERVVVIDKTPLSPFINNENSKFYGGLALDNDSLSFALEINEEETTLVEFRWAPPPVPVGGWNYQRELEPINQNEVEFLDNEGENVNTGACGPSAMASCLKWLANQYPGSTTGATSVEQLAQNLAREAGTTAAGTRDDNLATAAGNQLANDEGITDEMEITRHFNTPSGQNTPYHNVYDDIAGGLRDSADVVMLIYQVGPNGDTLGHYVTASSHHTTISYYSGDFGCAAVQTSYVDFMDPSTGETEYKTITWYDNPPKITDYDLHPDASGDAWVHEVITIKPKKESKSQGKNGLIANFPVDEPGSYHFSLPCSSLPEGVQMIGIFGVNNAGEKQGSYFACANGKYDVVAAFTADKTTFIPGYPVHFSNLSNPAGNISGYGWDFGDGNISNEQNPDHSYESAGFYNVSLAVSDGINTDTLIRENYIQIVPPTEQEILLFEGWNSLSGYVSPVDSLLQNLMSPMIENLVIVKNYDGIFWPEENVNTLNYWHKGAGFSIKLLNDEIFVFRGMGHVDKSHQLDSGWEFLPVLSPCEVPATEIGSQLGGNLTLIKEITGNRVYWPAVGITTLTSLEPGRAYIIHLNNQAQIHFPECDKQAGVVENPASYKVDPANHPFDIVKTPFTHLLCFENPVNKQPHLAKAIVAFDMRGNCFGYNEITSQGQNQVLAAYGDDPSTPVKDGFYDGDKMRLCLLTASHQIVEIQQLTFDAAIPDKDIFTINGLSKINGYKTGTAPLPAGNSNLIMLYPNPAGDFVTVAGLEGNASIEISTPDGQTMIRQQVSPNDRIDVSSLNSGMYFVKITGSTPIFTGKIVVK